MPSREADSKSVFQAAVGGANIELVGPRLSGKSSILHSVIDEYNRAGLGTVHVRGTGDHLPLASLRAAVSEAVDRSNVLALSPVMLADLIAERKPAAIVIDDGDLLDLTSWEVIVLAQRASGVAIISAIAPGQGKDDPRSLLRLSPPPVRVVVQSLGLDGVQDFLEQRLGGMVAPSLASRIHTKSAGRVGMVSALSETAISQGRIRRIDNVWVDTPDLWSRELETVYESIISTCDDGLTDAIEGLALAGATEITTIARFVGNERLEALERMGLVKIFSVRSHVMVAVEPPGLADYFFHQPPTSRRVRILQSIMAATQRDVVSGEDLPGVNPVRGLLEIAPTSRAELPQLTRMFSDSFKAASAAALDEWRKAQSVQAANRVLSLQISGAHDANIIEEVLERTPLEGADEWEELGFRYRRSRWALISGRSVDECIETLVHDVSRYFGYRPALEALSLALRMELQSIRGEDLTRLGEIAEREGANGDIARLVLAYGQIMTLDGESALETLDAAPLIPVRFIAAQYEIARGLALFVSGRAQEATSWAEDHLERCLAEVDRDGLVGHSFVAILALASVGEFERALGVAQVVLSTGIEAGETLFAPDRAILCLLAFVAIRTDRASAARSLAERAEQLKGRSDGIPFGRSDLLGAAQRAAEGFPEEAAEHYRRIAGDLSARGYQLSASTLVMLSLVLHYDAEVARNFDIQNDVLAGDLFRAWIAGQEAQRHDDAAGLVEAGRILRTFRARDESLKMLSQAVRILRAAGDDELAEEAQNDIRMLLDDSLQHDGNAMVEFGLTPREMEIVQDIAIGLSNTEIANRFGISVRTIDSHLRNIRQKTGAFDREDLARLGGKTTAQ